MGKLELHFARRTREGEYEQGVLAFEYTKCRTQTRHTESLFIWSWFVLLYSYSSQTSQPSLHYCFCAILLLNMTWHIQRIVCDLDYDFQYVTTLTQSRDSDPNVCYATESSAVIQCTFWLIEWLAAKRFSMWIKQARGNVTPPLYLLKWKYPNGLGYLDGLPTWVWVRQLQAKPINRIVLSCPIQKTFSEQLS